MSAPIRRTRTKNDDELNAIAKEIVSYLNEFAKRKEQQHANVSTLRMNAYYVGHGARPFGSYLPNDYIDFCFTYGRQSVKDLSYNDLATILRLLNASLPEAISSAKIIFEEFEGLTIPKVITILGEPCKEFKTLVAYLKRNCNKEVTPTTFYSVRLFGKRSVYDESGERNYMCFNPKWCEETLDEAKKAKKRWHKVSFKVKEHDDIDTEYSSYYETECYGLREVYPEFASV